MKANKTFSVISALNMNVQIAVVSAIIATICKVQSETFTKFISAKCTVYDPRSISVDYCFVKPFSRKASFLNVGVILAKNLGRPAYVKEQVLHFKYFSRSLFRFRRISS